MVSTRGEGEDELVTRMLSKQRPRDALEEQQALANIEHRILGHAPALVQLSRYVLLERLGQGGAGVVYAAYDPELDRKVAIKLLRHDVGEGSTGSDGELRLLREAQAMAKLSHPNVIAVYDVGTYAEGDLNPVRPDVVAEDDDAPSQRGVFVVMELVEGKSLSQWMREGVHDWREVVRLYVAAGRGLAAAHATGLVHRDFKPGNVLIGGDGRVRVLDFGLARAHGEPSGANLEAAVQQGLKESGAISLALQSPLTETGTVMGTPPYMAPEQHRGEPADAAADQFSFCVALFEALFGRRPFRADTIEELRRQKDAAKPPAPPEDSRVPAWVQQIVARGLSRNPADRYPTMAALLTELDRDPAARRRRLLALAAGVAIVAGAGAGVYGWAKQRSELCQGQDAKVAAVWSDGVRTAVHESFRASGKPYAEQAFASVSSALDDYTDRWVRVRTDTCREAMVERSLGLDQMEERNLCLDQRLASVGELTRQLRADTDLVERAVEVTATLPPLEVCTEAGAGRPEIVVDEATRVRLVALDDKLVRAHTLASIVKYDEARGLIAEALEEARVLGHRATEARARLELGRVHYLQGKFDPAEDELYAALEAAEEVGDADIATRALIQLVYVVGVEQARHAEGQRLVQQAHARLRRRGLDDTLMAEFHYQHGALLHSTGKFAEELEPHSRALEIYETKLGPQNHRVAVQLNSLGLAHYRLGNYGQAKDYMGRSLEIWEAKLGPHHPQVATVINNLGIVAMARGDNELALERYHRSLDIRVAALGEGHPLLVTTYSNIGNAYHAAGRFERALEHQSKAVATARAAYGEDHPNLAMVLGNEGTALFELGRLEEAEANHRKALAIYEQRLDADHPSFGYPYINLSDVLLAKGELDESRKLAERTLELWEASFGPRHAHVAAALASLGRVELALSNTTRARELFERAYGISKGGEDQEVLAQTTYGLARALPVRERERALTMARTAREAFAGLGKQKQVDEVDAWLAKNG